MNKTYATKKSDIKTDWRLIDAKDRVLGRLATEVANILMGKDKPYYAKNQVCGDKVIVTNTSFLKVTGNKAEDKMYVRHSGFIGGLRKESFESLNKRLPGEALKLAVLNMLPRNRLRKKLIANLYLYPKETHPHQGQVK